jgi:hypothetical protein
MDHDADAGAAAASLVLACGLLLKKKAQKISLFAHPDSRKQRPDLNVYRLGRDWLGA